MALCECDDQFVPTLTPCSAASLRLKNMRLPRIQRSVGLPRTDKVVDRVSDVWTSSVAMAKAAAHITLRNISVISSAKKC